MKVNSANLTMMQLWHLPSTKRSSTISRRSDFVWLHIVNMYVIEQLGVIDDNNISSALLLSYYINIC